MLNTLTFAQQMEALGLKRDAQQFYVACSGGADSLCLTLLMKQWLGDKNDRLTALIVDHNLRASSENEAVKVKELLKKHGIKAEVLCWLHEPITSGIEQKARTARYELIYSHIKSRGDEAPVLLTGHHRDDQHETLLMRLGRGTKLRGLSGMSSLVQADGVRLARPLLGFGKVDILRVIEAFDAAPVEDPSNDDVTLKRNWLRSNKPELAKAKLDVSDLHEFQVLIGRLRSWIEQEAVTFIEQHVELNQTGFAVIDRLELALVNRAIQEDVLLRLINWLSPNGDIQSLPTNSFDQLVDNGASVNGVRSKVSGGKLYTFLEVRRGVEPQQTSLESGLTKSARDQGYSVGVLGKKRAQMYRQHIEPNLPSYILAGLLVMESKNDGHTFCIPQLKFANNINKMPSLNKKFGLMRKPEPSKQIFKVVSAKDSLT